MQFGVFSSVKNWSMFRVPFQCGQPGRPSIHEPMHICDDHLYIYIWQLQHSASSQFLGIWVALKQNHDPPIGK